MWRILTISIIGGCVFNGLPRDPCGGRSWICLRQDLKNVYFGLHHLMIFWGFPGSSAGKESAYNAGDLGSIPGSGRFPGEGNGYPLQYSYLENLINRGVWQATFHGGCRVRHDCVMITFMVKSSTITQWCAMEVLPSFLHPRFSKPSLSSQQFLYDSDKRYSVHLKTMLLTVHIYNAWSGPKMEGTLAVLHPAKEKAHLKVMPIISTAA